MKTLALCLLLAPCALAQQQYAPVGSKTWVDPQGKQANPPIAFLSPDRCGPDGYRWDEKTKTCVINITVSAPDASPVTCDLKHEDGKAYIHCAYKPKETK